MFVEIDDIFDFSDTPWSNLSLIHISDSVLHPDDFVCIKANWDPKDQNLKAIAAELSLGADSFVFADDNPRCV